MIPYELIIPSASRPHLLDTVLEPFFARTDQAPSQLLLHDDGVFPGKKGLIEDVLRHRVPPEVSLVWTHDPAPIKHGPALKWLLDRVSRPYVLYMQDDHKV